MSGNSKAYLIGVSNIAVGISAVSTIVPRTGVLNGFLQVKSLGTSGIVALVNGDSLVGASAVSVGTVLIAGEKYELEGPAKFYLAAAVNSVTVTFTQRLSAGATLG